MNLTRATALIAALMVTCGVGVGQAAATDDAAQVSVFIGRDAAGLSTLVAALSTPGSPQYRHFLTPQQVQAQFGATDEQRSAVAGWLTSLGLTVNHGDPYTVAATGTSAQAAAAAATKAPVTVAPIVRALYISGGSPLHASALAAATPTSCSAYFGEKPATGLPEAYGQQPAWATCGYEPQQLRSAYGVTGAGKGVTVAVISPESDDMALSEVNQWSTAHHVKPFDSAQFTTDIVAGAAVAGLSESAMDIEAVHGMAPDAKMVYSVGSGKITGSSLLDSLHQIVIDKSADIVTSSWAEGYLPDVDQGLIQGWEAELSRAAVEGITVNSATGDDGDRVGLQFPGADPLLTAVGGTSLAIDVAGGYVNEKPWENDTTPLNSSGTGWDPAPPGTFDSGSTGGVSEFPMPAYQRGVVTGNVVDGQARRAVPDVAAFADWYLGFPVGVIVDGVYRTSVNGGTSLAAPLLAGIEATAGTPIGFANPTLYGLAGGPAFHDVAGGGPVVAFVKHIEDERHPRTVLVTAGQCQENATMTCGAGYDTTTGLGSPAAEFARLVGGASNTRDSLTTGSQERAQVALHVR